MDAPRIGTRTMDGEAVRLHDLLVSAIKKARTILDPEAMSLCLMAEPRQWPKFRHAGDQGWAFKHSCIHKTFSKVDSASTSVSDHEAALVLDQLLEWSGFAFADGEGQWFVKANVIEEGVFAWKPGNGAEITFIRRPEITGHQSMPLLEAFLDRFICLANGKT